MKLLVFGEVLANENCGHQRLIDVSISNGSNVLFLLLLMKEIP